jgi:hypothetical protein
VGVVANYHDCHRGPQKPGRGTRCSRVAWNIGRAARATLDPKPGGKLMSHRHRLDWLEWSGLLAAIVILVAYVWIYRVGHP